VLHKLFVVIVMDNNLLATCTRSCLLSVHSTSSFFPTVHNRLHFCYHRLFNIARKK